MWEEREERAAKPAKLLLYVLTAGLLLAALAFPMVGGAGAVVNRLSDRTAQDTSALLQGDAPIISTMVDIEGNPIAWIYTQRRWEVPTNRIANTMKLAIVSIEDKRFGEHNGVDLQGSLTGLAGYLKGAVDTRGGSTIEQQYVKNFNFLVNAENDTERRAAIETTPIRKLREMRMALELDKALPKAEILTRYLNLVAFGNGSFGVQDAAKTYFGVNAADLNWQQAALLAGLVQSTSTLNPYTNPEGALARRNLVLDTLIQNLPDKADELRKAKEAPLGVLPKPAPLPQGCIGAGDRAFFCDYALSYLAKAGIGKEELARNGYLIRTTLDPKVQDSVKKAIDKIASPDLDGVASVMTVIKPGRDAHRVLAMGDNRTYGLELNANETVQPQPFTTLGDGGGSTFKIFTTAAALEMGMGINAKLDVPATFQGAGLGDSNTPGCPPRTWCVKNAGGGARGPMNVTDALAQSPNTAFAKLIQQVGVSRAVDMAVRLGLRSYAEPGSARDYDPNYKGSLADYIKEQNLGSFTLGPFELNALEMSNVAATLASGGMWCPPTPIDKVLDRRGREVPVPQQKCEQVVPEGLANTLTNALGKDHTSGTGASAAGSVGWTLPMAGKTGTTESHRSSAFLGYTNQFAAANYIFDDTPAPKELCSWPLRRCSSGNLYGGNEPARTWFNAMKPIADELGPVSMPPTAPRYVDGAPTVPLPSIKGLKFDAARKKLQDAGFQVADQPSPVDSYLSKGTIVGTTPKDRAVPGFLVTINTSTGVAPYEYYPSRPSDGPPPPQAPPPPPTDGNVVNIPGLPPIFIPGQPPPPPPPFGAPPPPPFGAPPPPPVGAPPPPPPPVGAPAPPVDVPPPVGVPPP
ncbi:transglycosylase/D,D-transpeptidase PonA2 [Mycolicibacterium sp. 120270]|uniref:transglycosylase/D,D-transpeptidase PonA2 n=1 Tax=Mycolicibacterium sp. 120270 TaxID=3090600 RepID=UPI00299F2421|nr:transglycosylase/D,D-transpeptidase PonA2 [Mycolicibacterium sp. 120270]MDX1882282.1 transglycosylase/D,D-transpeptidase PonA2 [Mycolicibacterium sp. 120270]